METNAPAPGHRDVLPATALVPPPILIVDDDDGARELIDATLASLDLLNPRWHAQDGATAVRLMTEAIGGAAPVPALVMLDGQMPGMSGLEVLEWMRGQPPLATVPVVMLTGMSDVSSIRSAYDRGAASYLVKPVAFEALSDVLRGLAAPWMLL